MPITENASAELRGMYRDVLRAPDGHVIWDSGWNKNAIVTSCHTILACLMQGTGSALGIQGLLVGAGQATWDASGTPPATSGQIALVDPSPLLVKVTDPNFQIDFLSGGAVTSTPTNRLQISVKLGPGVATGSLREFGLAGQIGTKQALINYVTHIVITKDPSSTLDRTLWLTF